MLSFLKGKIEFKEQGIIGLDVNGVGYEILVSTETFSSIGNVGDYAKIFVYLVIRENEILLMGFLSLEEKNLFLNLISVSGVGPKTALLILSGSNCAGIISSIITGDISLISNAKGVGKKTAERIVLELKEKFIKENGNIVQNVNNNDVVLNNSVVSDAVLALISLGLSKQEAENSVRNVYNNNMPLEEVISKALRRI